MKPFNLEEAKAGKPIITRNGTEVKIIYFEGRKEFPVVGYIIYPNGGNSAIQEWTNEGRFHISKARIDEFDLFIKEEVIERDGWILIKKFKNGSISTIYDIYDDEGKSFFNEKFYEAIDIVKNKFKEEK